MNIRTQQQVQHSPAGKPPCRSIGAGALVLGLLLFFILPGIACAGDGVVLRLLETCSASGNAIAVGDVTEFVSGDDRLWQLVSAEPVGTVPRRGHQVQHYPEEILGLLAQRGYDWRMIDIQGAASVTVHNYGQSVSAKAIAQCITDSLKEAFSTPVEMVIHRPLAAVDVTGGDVELGVRYPDKPGSWLPTAIEFKVDGRLATTLPLSQHMQFRLRAVVAPEGISSRTRISPTHLGYEEVLLSAGMEAVADVAQVVGMDTRSAVSPGGMVRISRLKAPYDVTRGSEVMLIISVDGVVLEARAVAMNDAYTGQSLLVKRVQDGKKYSGLVIEGPAVVVQ